MKFFKLIFLILVVFLKTGNLLSENNFFSVNNIVIEKEDNSSNKRQANKAIKKAFNKLIERILLKEDREKVSQMKISQIKELVAYYNISKNIEGENDKKIFSVSFDKDKIHNLLYKKGILYSEIYDKEFFVLPILIFEDEISVFTNNYFYENWNFNDSDVLIEFILPLENIEIIQKINQTRNNLLDLDLSILFKEYSKKNIAIVFINKDNSDAIKVYLKTRIQDKIISKNFNFKKNDLDKFKFNKKVILEIKDEIINLVKSQNLVDVRTPSFLNVKFNLNSKNNLISLNSKLKNIDLIENIFVQEFNKDYVFFKIKYYGKLEKIINQLIDENISLKLINDQWFIKVL